jgi:hypothetical protein
MRCGSCITLSLPCHAGGVKNATHRYDLPPPPLAVRNLVRGACTSPLGNPSLHDPNKVVAPPLRSDSRRACARRCTRRSSRTCAR